MNPLAQVAASVAAQINVCTCIGMRCAMFYKFIILSFEQTKIGDTVAQIVDPKQDEISRTIHIGNVTATVHSTMISSVLQVQTQITRTPI